MEHEKIAQAATSTIAHQYPYIFNLALVNGQYQHDPAQYCVARCVCCRKVHVILAQVHNFAITHRLAEGWYELGQDIAPNLGGVFCPECRPPGEDWEIVRADGRVATTIHRLGLEAAQTYLNEHQTQYQNCTIRPRAPTP